MWKNTGNFFPLTLHVKMTSQFLKICTMDQKIIFGLVVCEANTTRKYMSFFCCLQLISICRRVFLDCSPLHHRYLGWTSGAYVSWKCLCMMSWRPNSSKAAFSSSSNSPSSRRKFFFFQTCKRYSTCDLSLTRQRLYSYCICQRSISTWSTSNVLSTTVLKSRSIWFSVLLSSRSSNPMSLCSANIRTIARSFRSSRFSESIMIFDQLALNKLTFIWFC